MCKEWELEEEPLNDKDINSNSSQKNNGVTLENRLEVVTKESDKNIQAFSHVNGNRLLFLCVVALAVMFLIEVYTNEVDIRKNIIEIYKSLIFILSGFLFAKYKE